MSAANFRSSSTASRSSRSPSRPRTTTCSTSSSSRASTHGTPNSVESKFEGTGGLAYQIVGRTFTPWKARPVSEPLSIDVAYDRTRLAQDDIATAKVTVRNNLSKTANMIMVDLGIPPGFDLLSEDLQSLQEKAARNQNGSLQKFSLTATQAILYFNGFSAANRYLHLSPAREVSDPRTYVPVARL